MNKTEKDIVFDTINDYRLKINRRIDMDNLAGAIREAEYLKEYLVRTKKRRDGVMNPTFKSMLKTAYICGLETVGEGINNWLLHSTQCYPYDQVAEKEKQLMEGASGYADEVLISALLTKEERQKLDDDLDEAMEGMSHDTA